MVTGVAHCEYRFSLFIKKLKKKVFNRAIHFRIITCLLSQRQPLIHQHPARMRQ